MQEESILGRRYDQIGRAHSYVKGERADARDAIVKSILPHSKMVEIPCLCGANFYDQPIAKIDRWGIPISAVLCMQCGLMRLHPRWDNDTYFEIYREYFWPLQMGCYEVSRERFQLSVERAAGFADFLMAHYDLTGKKVLEIGCSYGAGLYRLQNKGAKLVGYDYDSRILNIGRAYTDLDLREGGLSAALEAGERYDLVILRHVFEHFLNPISEGIFFKNLLTDEGRLFIEVPGVFNDKEWYPEPLMVFNAFHTFYYSLSMLIHVLSICGFTLVAGDEHIYSLWCPDKEFSESSWQDKDLAKSVLRFLKWKERERQRRKWLASVQLIAQLPTQMGRYLLKR